MSTTTDILFNSPALHSLKRDQLVKLCKIHSIKANGKNTELVDRLKNHAKNLPNDSPLSVALRSEQGGAPEVYSDDEEGTGARMPRPSSQWEVVMDSITEEAEESSSQGTLSSLRSATTLAGEFGTGGSKSTMTVSSSIKALASSFGLRRHATGGSTSLNSTSSKTSSKLLSSFPLPPDPNDELLNNSTPYHSLPPPSMEDLQTDHFTFDTTDPAVVTANLNPTLGTAPLPGHTLRPGAPAPINARLSLGLAPRTPSKQGPTTTIRLVSFGNGTSNAASSTTLPPPGDTPNLKPFKIAFDLDLGSPSAPSSFFPGSIYPALPASPPMDEAARRMSLEAKMVVDADEEVAMPGGFGFSGPATPTSVKPFVFGSPSSQLAAPRFSFTVASPDATTKAKLAAEVLEEMNRRVFGDAGGPSSPPRLIRPLPGSAKKGGGSAERKPGAGRFDKAHEKLFDQMESIADVAVKRQGLKRKSSAASARVAFTGAAEEQGRGKRARMDEANAEAEAATEKKKKQEKEAVRRKLEVSRAKRRSSAAAGARRVSGRVSGAGVLLKEKPKPGRFGFFAGAAKLVQGVWGKKEKGRPAPATSRVASSSSAAAPKSAASAKPPTGLGKMHPPPAPAVASGSGSTNTSLRPPSVRSMVSTRSTSGGRARSPLPPSFTPTPSAASKATAASSARTRNSSSIAGSSIGTRTSSAAAGSMGTRASSLRVSSLGTRGSLSSANTANSTVDSARKTGGRPSSRLLAPTASSLAKINGGPNSSPGAALAVVPETKDGNAKRKVLDSIIDNAAPGAAGSTRAKGKMLSAPARKPRISRSRVIAKLASQRVASGSSSGSGALAPAAGPVRKSLGAGAGRTRSSLGVKVQRGSLAGIKNSSAGGGRPSAVMLDAKKRARQSEYYARRKSRAAEAMNVDP